MHGRKIIPAVDAEEVSVRAGVHRLQETEEFSERLGVYVNWIIVHER